MKKAKKYIVCLLVATILMLGLTGCGNSASTAAPTLPVKPTFENKSYDSLENGLGAFYNNYTALKAYLDGSLILTSPVEKLNSDFDRSLYDNFMLLMSLAELELSVLPEFDLLSVMQDYTDRAEGELPISNSYGYKIKQSRKIKFGYESSDKKTLTGSLDTSRGLLTVTIDDPIDEATTCKTVAEIVLADENSLVMRYAKSVAATQTTQVFYVLMQNSNVVFAYYEGAAQISSFIALDTLPDYNIDALIFGVGINLSFNFEL